MTHRRASPAERRLSNQSARQSGSAAALRRCAVFPAHVHMLTELFARAQCARHRGPRARIPLPCALSPAQQSSQSVSVLRSLVQCAPLHRVLDQGSGSAAHATTQTNTDSTHTRFSASHWPHSGRPNGLGSRGGPHFLSDPVAFNRKSKYKYLAMNLFDAGHA